MASQERRLAAYNDVFPGLPMRTSDLKTQSIYTGFIKPALETFLALIALVPAAVIIAVCALFIMRDGHAPFYKQMRIGKNGRNFGMWKLRSMVPNADQVLEAYLDANPTAREEWTRTQKLKHDPRITHFGHFIRKTSIDELPQLFNVLRGEMALVGPRPMMVDQRALYPGVAYYALRPGITGYWQTSTRNDSSFAERATFDTSYFRDVSLGTDLRVMAKTVGVVIAGTGY